MPQGASNLGQQGSICTLFECELSNLTWHEYQLRQQIQQRHQPRSRQILQEYQTRCWHSLKEYVSRLLTIESNFTNLVVAKVRDVQCPVRACEKRVVRESQRHHVFYQVRGHKDS